MHIHVIISGWLLAALAAIHVFFPRYFGWKKELAPLSLVNRQMFYVHSFFIGLGVFLMGLLCIISPGELLASALGRTVCLGMGVFWSIRLYFQLFVYSSELWRGKRFETAVHILFSVLWLYFAAVFILGYARQT